MRLRLPDRVPFDYQVERNNFSWADHILRLQLTGALISWFQPDTIFDPACGDGSIVAAAHRARPIAAAVMADISRPNFYMVGTRMRPSLPDPMTVECATLEESLAVDRFFDVIVLTEILEHVEDPTKIVSMARARAKILVASSPLFNSVDGGIDSNPEHLWQFDAIGYEEMLKEGGWTPVAFVPIHLADFMYDYQIWGMR